MPAHPIKRALISVYDKTGIVEFARALHGEFGIEIISTGGTAKLLTESGVPVTLVEEVTGFPEMLDGRVKTLHPKIHAAILADRDNPEHMRQLAEQGIKPIDMVVVNLYPFEKTVADPNCTFVQAIEMIDIGGVCLLRAAAKNHRHVLVCESPDPYPLILESLRHWSDERTRLDALRSGAFGAFWQTARYDARVATWLGTNPNDGKPDVRALHFWSWGPLRYGENPHQTAELLKSYDCSGAFSEFTAADTVDEGAIGLSFNNWLDSDAGLHLCSELHLAGWHVWHRPLAGDVPPASSRWRPVRGEQYSRRNLPHIQNPGKTYFITFKTNAGFVLPPDARTIILNACRYWHGKKMNLHAVVVMPTHVHLLLTPYLHEDGSMVSLGELLHSMKGFSAHKVNELLGRTGPLWLDESWDRIMRNEKEFAEEYEYIETNPHREHIEENYRWFWRSGARFEESGLAPFRPQTSGEQSEAGHRLEAGGTLHRPEAGATPSAPLMDSFAPAICVFIKHNNACGVGVADDPIEAYRRAYTGDVNAAMGGILACNFAVTPEFAEVVMDSLPRWGKGAGAGAFFVEVWIAPSFIDDKTVEVIRSRKKWGEKVRLLDVGDMSQPRDEKELMYRSIAGGMLVQTVDAVGLNEDQWKVVTQRGPDEREIADLRLAWLIAKHTKSNAISVCKDAMLIGNGAGQMSRVMSCRIATWLAKDNGHAAKLAGAVAASDAFFPFRDGPDLLLEAGVTAIIQPGGSKRDEDTIAACNERGAAMIFTGTRHFRH